MEQIAGNYSYDLQPITTILRDKRSSKRTKYNVLFFARYLPKTQELAKAIVWFIWYESSTRYEILGDFGQPISLKNIAVDILCEYPEEIIDLLDKYIDRTKERERWQARNALKKVKKRIINNAG